MHIFEKTYPNLSKIILAESDDVEEYFDLALELMSEEDLNVAETVASNCTNNDIIDNFCKIIFD